MFNLIFFSYFKGALSIFSIESVAHDNDNVVMITVGMILSSINLMIRLSRRAYYT